MRREGASRHPDLRWVDDRMPEVAAVHRLGLAFDLVLLGAVWMHVAPAERPRAFRKVATLLRPGGLVLLSLRHGPDMERRDVHPVTLGEVEALARDHGLSVVRATAAEDVAPASRGRWCACACRTTAASASR